MEIEIKVPAVPVAQPRQRHRGFTGGNGKTFVQNYTPAKHPVQSFKATVRMAFENVYVGPPMTGALRCDLVFVMPRPQNLIWKTREMPRIFHAKKPDYENLIKGTVDALTGLAWIDDAQIAQGETQKWIAAGDEAPHVLIRIRELE